MADFKFSCPHRQQHIQSEAGSAGTEIQCPACQNALVIPAAPDEPSGKLSIAAPPRRNGPAPATQQRSGIRPPQKSPFRLSLLFAFAVPVIAVALIFAFIHFAQKPPGETNSKSEAPEQSSTTNTASRNSSINAPSASSPELEKAGMLMAAHVRAVIAARARVDQAERSRSLLHATYKGKNLDHKTYGAVMQRYKAAADEANSAQAALSAARNNFEQGKTAYEKLGGKTDYEAQLK